MASARAGRLALVLAATTVLAACEPGQDFNLFGALQSNTDTIVDVPAGAVETQGRDVESPEVFQVSDAGLWDGRPSLGGVWIAHPDVTDPERVLIRNLDTGNSVIGALFRRERENPGPRFQVSSDAAAELGMLAGAPNGLSVVALRRVAVPVIADPVEILQADAETVAAATAAVVGAPKTITAAPAAPQVPIASIAASAIEAATANNPTASLPAPATAAVTPVARPAKASLSAAIAPFIKIGIFGDQSSADDATKLLRASGIIPTVETLVDDGQKIWQVYVGPIGTPADLAALLDQVQTLGFAGAFPVIK